MLLFKQKTWMIISCWCHKKSFSRHIFNAGLQTLIQAHRDVVFHSLKYFQPNSPTKSPNQSTVSSYLAFSYILIVIRVSSMVLLTSVLILDTKKLMAPSRVSPFLHSNFWVSALNPNSSCKGEHNKKEQSVRCWVSLPKLCITLVFSSGQPPTQSISGQRVDIIRRKRFWDLTRSSGDFWLRSAKVSPSACCVCTML